jgi:hypothetical protein
MQIHAMRGELPVIAGIYPFLVDSDPYKGNRSSSGENIGEF